MSKNDWPAKAKLWLRWNGCGDLVNYIEQLEADKRRLDWLATCDSNVAGVYLLRECVEANPDSLRDAIDHAMNAHATQHPEAGGV